MSSDPSGSGSRLAAAVAVGLPVLVLALLWWKIDVDPVRGVTFSNAPFTDEGWRALNARNLVMFGSWSTDELSLHLVQAPLSVAQSLVFGIAGIGLTQARAISVVAMALMAAVIVIGLRRPLGLAGSLAAGVAVSFAPLMLFYGRLAMLEVPVAMALTVAAVALLRAGPGTVGRSAAIAGVFLVVAIGLKANALASVAGILLAAGWLGYREPWLRRWLAFVIGIVGVAVVVWGVAVALPNVDALQTTVSTLPTAAIPAGVREWLRNIVRYVRSSDGVIPLAGTLFIGAVVALLALAAGHRPTFGRARGPFSAPVRVALVGILWTVCGFIGVASFDYQPNRYVVPVLPGLALIIGSGVSVIVTGLGSRPMALRGGVVAVVLVALAAPGLYALSDWTGRGTHTVADGQAAVEQIVVPGTVLAGRYGPLFAMRVKTPTVVPFPDSNVNTGDLYASGVRWGFAEDDIMPTWAGDRPDIWAARREEWCASWGREPQRVCLVELP